MSFLSPYAVVSQMPIISGDRVLDIGCGLGAFSIAIVERYPHVQVTAMDIDRDKLDILASSTLRLGHPSIHTLECDIADIWPVDTLSIDGAVLANILHAFTKEKINFILAELHRVMRPHSVAIVIEWNSDITNMGPRHHAISEDIMRSLLSKNGFKVKENIPAGSHHYGLLIETI